MSKPIKRLVIVAQADPVLCGHSTEARNLAEVALRRGFDDVRIVTWPLEALKNLPLKPLDQVLPCSRGIVVVRPEPIGDYKCVDCRFSAGLVGRLVELSADGVPTTCLSLYLAFPTTTSLRMPCARRGCSGQASRSRHTPRPSAPISPTLFAIASPRMTLGPKGLRPASS